MHPAPVKLHSNSFIPYLYGIIKMDNQYLYNTLVTSSLGCTGKLRHCLNFQPQVVQLLNILHNSIMVQEYIYRYIFQLQIVHLLETLQNSIVLQKFPQNLIRQIQNQHQKGFKIVHPKTHYIMIQEFDQISHNHVYSLGQNILMYWSLSTAAVGQILLY